MELFLKGSGTGANPDETRDGVHPRVSVAPSQGEREEIVWVLRTPTLILRSLHWQMLLAWFLPGVEEYWCTVQGLLVGWQLDRAQGPCGGVSPHSAFSEYPDNIFTLPHLWKFEPP